MLSRAAYLLLEVVLARCLELEVIRELLHAELLLNR